MLHDDGTGQADADRPHGRVLGESVEDLADALDRAVRSAA
jgi:hypothetical protein